MNITPMLVGVAFAMFVLLNVAAVYRVHLRHRRVRSALDLPRRMGQADRTLQVERAVEVFAETDAKLRKRAPHLSTEERHEMARALMRAKGILLPVQKSKQ
jgi:ABC-type branched-subunit amino acid transport system ATPase component